MSKVGRAPITVSQDVTVTIDGQNLTVKGSKGELKHTMPRGITAKLEEGVLVIARTKDTKEARALHGLTRALVANMVTGVKDGYAKKLELVGTGYRAKLAGNKLVLSLGFSHEVNFDIPEGIKLSLEGNNLLTVEGIDKNLVGQTAADIRSHRKPEPYKGKGIKYEGEVIRRKAGKAAKGAAA